MLVRLIRKTTLLCLVLFMLNNISQGQNKSQNDSINGQQKPKSKLKINLGTDLMSRYIWRGKDYGTSPSIQPLLSLNKCFFEIGIWGSYNVKGSYAETDPYIKFTYKGASLIFTDYFIHDESNPNNTNYFNYKHNETLHGFELALQYKGPEKFPISIYAGTFLYGNDQNIKKDTAGNVLSSKQFYSTYFELGYTLTYLHNNFDLFLGVTPMEGMYATKAGVVAAGLTASRSITIKDDLAINLKATIFANPVAKNLYFIFGAGFSL